MSVKGWARTTLETQARYLELDIKRCREVIADEQKVIAAKRAAIANVRKNLDAHLQQLADVTEALAE